MYQYQGAEMMKNFNKLSLITKLFVMCYLFLCASCASVKYVDPKSSKEIHLNTFMKEVSVNQLTSPEGDVIVKEFHSRSVTEWLQSLLDGLGDTARGVLGVRGGSIPVEFNFPGFKPEELEENE